MMRNILCLKWGTLYSAEYVNRLYRGVKRNLSGEFRFVCVTDDPKGLEADIDAEPIPPRPPEMKNLFTYAKHGWPNIYIKLCLFKPGFAKLEGPTLFLDIDQIITGPLDDFFTYRPGDFCIIHNWVEWRKTLFRKAPFCGNSSCFRFDAGERSGYIYQQFLADLENDTAMDRKHYVTEQAYMTHAVGFDKVHFWPDNYVRSFKRSCVPCWPLNHILMPKFNPDTRILCFHGDPTPEAAIAGYRGKHLNTWTKPCPWVKALWEK